TGLRRLPSLQMRSMSGEQDDEVHLELGVPIRLQFRLGSYSANSKQPTKNLQSQCEQTNHAKARRAPKAHSRFSTFSVSRRLHKERCYPQPTPRRTPSRRRSDTETTD